MLFYEKYAPLLNMDSPQYDNFVFTGGRGSMKTGHGCRGILLNILQNTGKKKKRVVCFRETKTSQKDSLITEFQGLIDGEFKNRGFRYNSEAIYHAPSGSSISFLGLRDSNANAREALKGLAQVDIWLVDEAQAVSKPVWDVLLKTIRKEGAKLIVIYNRIEENLPVEEALFLDYERMQAPKHTYFAEVNYPELVHLDLLSPRFLEQAELLQKNKPEEFERDYLNKPRGANVAKVVKYWSKDNENEQIRFCADLDIYWSLDFNVNPACSTLAHYDGQCFYVFDELVLNNVITQDVVDEFMNRYPPDKVKGVVQICGDASGKYRKTQSRYSDYAIISNTLAANGYRVNFNLRRFNPPIAARCNAFNKQVFDNSGVRHVFVHPRCKWLLYNMRNLKYKAGTSLIDAPTPAEIAGDDDKLYLGHIFDAVSYMVEFFKPVIRD